MPRRARNKSKTGIYHIMMRGSNRQEIFHDEEDCLKFLEIFNKYKTESELEIYGWCLMGNHIHLLLKEGTEELANTMKRIGVSYVWFYNWKYKTSGHLLQDRYRSENVEDDRYLLTVVRYIHQNPVKSAMVKAPAGWKWSSCHEYYGMPGTYLELTDTGFILGMISTDKDEAIRLFKEYNEMQNEDMCMEDNSILRLSDEEARGMIVKALEGCSITEIKAFPKVKRDEVLIKLKRLNGISQRQTARILGISPNLIFKAK